MSINIRKNIHKVQHILFDYVIILSYIIYFLAALGILAWAPKYLYWIDLFIKVYVSIFLIWRFNPFRPFVPFTNLDKKVVFSSGMILLTNICITYLLPKAIALFTPKK